MLLFSAGYLRLKLLFFNLPISQNMVVVHNQLVVNAQPFFREILTMFAIKSAMPKYVYL
jgi:hypothetical protein